MRTLTVPEFQSELKTQGVARREDYAFKCPVCKTVQSMQSLIDVGAGKTAAEVETRTGFSCVGRFTNAGPYKRGAAAGKGCDWTLGGLFQLHELEIIDNGGARHPMFEIASAEEAQALAPSSGASPSKCGL